MKYTHNELLSSSIAASDACLGVKTASSVAISEVGRAVDTPGSSVGVSMITGTVGVFGATGSSILMPSGSSTKEKIIKRKPGKKPVIERPGVHDPLPLLLQGFEMVAKEEEWVHLAALGNALRQLDPAFDPRTFGHQRLQSLIKDYPETFVLKLDDSKTPPVAYIALTTQASIDTDQVPSAATHNGT